MSGMSSLDWNAIYLTCFAVGMVLSVLAFAGGFLHLHIGHFRFGGGHAPAGHMSPFNGFTVVAFLCWFGGTGYLLHDANILTSSLVLLFSALSGLAGASLIFWFLAKVLLPRERLLESADTDIVGVIGRLSASIPAHGVGEILYSQNGARRSASVRADGGEAIARGHEVVVMRYTRGVGYVKRWDEFEHGLMGHGKADSVAGDDVDEVDETT